MQDCYMPVVDEPRKDDLVRAAPLRIFFIIGQQLTEKGHFAFYFGPFRIKISRHHFYVMDTLALQQTYA